MGCTFVKNDLVLQYYIPQTVWWLLCSCFKGCRVEMKRSARSMDELKSVLFKNMEVD